MIGAATAPGARPRRATRSGAACALLILAVTWPSPAPAAASEWMPLQMGERRVYRSHLDTTLTPGGAPQERRFSVGRIRVEIVEQGRVSKRAGAPVFRIRRVEEVRPLAGEAPTRVESADYLASGRGGAFSFDPAEPNAAGAFPPSRASALQLLPPEVTPGTRWKAGVHRDGDATVELAGEVAGCENVEVLGARYEDCLRVELFGELAGSFLAEDGRSRVERGSYKQTLWLARGIGVVREERVTDLELKTPSGDPLRILTVMSLKLEPPAQSP